MGQFFVNILPLLLCFAAGAGLVILEVFLPGFGLPGISGIVLLGLGTWFTARAFSVGAAVVVLVLVVIALAVAVFFLLRSASNGKLENSPFFLKSKEAMPGLQKAQDALVGKNGTAVTALRPAGIALIDGARVDVVTEGSFIEAEEPVRVVLVRGNRIVVERNAVAKDKEA